MYSDSVLEELWKIKDENAKKYGFDIHAMAVALREKQGRNGGKIVTFETDEPDILSEKLK